MTGVRVVVLVSAGLNPISRQKQRAVRDAAAVDLALTLSSEPTVIHAGEPDEPLLRDYLGLGLKWITVVPIDTPFDCVPALVSCLREKNPDLILAGSRAESGDGTGMLPYLIAERLGTLLVPDVISAGFERKGAFAAALLDQSPKRGMRRRILAPLPVLATVGDAASKVNRFSWAQSRRGRIEIWKGSMLSEVDIPAPDIVEKSAIQKPRRLSPPTPGAQGGSGKVMVDPDPEAAADAILRFLLEKAILRNTSA